MGGGGGGGGTCAALRLRSRNCVDVSHDVELIGSDGGGIIAHYCSVRETQRYFYFIFFGGGGGGVTVVGNNTCGFSTVEQ